MDRNLGAMSAEVGNVSTANGLYYQFGRKDPFYFSKDKCYNIRGTVIRTGILKTASGQNQIVYASKNPNVFLWVNSGDWWYQNPYVNNPWYNPSWNPSPTGKSLFDPCPPGWALPRASVWKGIIKAYRRTNSKGIELYCNGINDVETSWYPMADGLYPLSEVGYDIIGTAGYVYTRDRNGGAYFLYFDNSSVYLSNNDDHSYGLGGGRAGGRSARCIQE